jgi:transposase-like protein
MGIKRKQRSAEFKARVAMTALSGEKTVAELSAEFGVHPTMISRLEAVAGDACGRAVCARQQGAGGRGCAEGD